MQLLRMRGAGDGRLGMGCNDFLPLASPYRVTVVKDRFWSYTEGSERPVAKESNKVGRLHADHFPA